MVLVLVVVVVVVVAFITMLVVVVMVVVVVVMVVGVVVPMVVVTASQHVLAHLLRDSAHPSLWMISWQLDFGNVSCLFEHGSTGVAVVKICRVSTTKTAIDAFEVM